MMRRIFRGQTPIFPDLSSEVETVPSPEHMDDSAFLDWRKPYGAAPWSCGGISWTEYWKEIDKSCSDEYHMVFVVFDYWLYGSDIVWDSFIAFRAKNLPALDPILKMGLEEITGNHPELIQKPFVVPSGWLYASYSSEALQIRNRIARLTERLIEVNAEMKKLENEAKR